MDGSSDIFGAVVDAAIAAEKPGTRLRDVLDVLRNGPTQRLELITRVYGEPALRHGLKDIYRVLNNPAGRLREAGIAIVQRPAGSGMFMIVPASEVEAPVPEVVAPVLPAASPVVSLPLSREDRCVFWSMDERPDWRQSLAEACAALPPGKMLVYHKGVLAPDRQLLVAASRLAAALGYAPVQWPERLPAEDGRRVWCKALQRPAEGSRAKRSCECRV